MKIVMNRRWWTLAASAFLLLCHPADPASAADKEKFLELPATLAEHAQREADTILLRATDTGNWDEAVAEAGRLLMAVSMSSEPIDEPDAWIESARAFLVTKLIAATSETSQQDLARLATIEPALVGEVAYLLNSHDNPKRAAAVLLRLYGQYGKVCTQYPALTAALCAVHDRTVSHRMNENSVKAPEPEQLFAYFLAWEDRLEVDLRTDPPEMLTYMVDVAPPIEELEWAMQRHSGMQQIGMLYKGIQYDTEHYVYGKVKKITEKGYTLQNISSYGGVCIDQAYYSAMVGKAIGVPAVMVNGSAASGGRHCWLGYLQRHGQSYQWDMDEGRYEQAKYFSGTVRDPQSGRRISEALIGISEQLFSTHDKERLLTRAIVEASLLLNNASRDPDPITLRAKKRATGRDAQSRKTPRRLPRIRKRGRVSADRLLRTGHELCPGSRELWNAMGWLAPGMDTKAMGWWIDAAADTGGDRWPEFTFVVTRWMLDVFEDDLVAAEAWEHVHRLYRGRPDLQIRALVAMGDRAADADRKDIAIQAYEQAIERFSGQSEYIIYALEGAQRLYKGVGRADLMPELFRHAWLRAKRPKDSALGFFRQSVWFRVGMMYADALDDAGQEQRAESIRNNVKNAGNEARITP